MSGIGLIPASVIVVLGAIHVYWGAGGRRGIALVVPQRDGHKVFTPGPRETLAVAVLLFLATLLIVGTVLGWSSPVPAWVYRWGSIGIGVVFFLRALGDFRYVGFFKRVRGTAFARWDTALFTPLCAVLGALIALALWR